MFALGLGLYVAQSLCALSGLELVSGRAAGVSQGWLVGGVWEKVCKDAGFLMGNF